MSLHRPEKMLLRTFEGPQPILWGLLENAWGHCAMPTPERPGKGIPRYMTVPEISKYLRLHPTTVYRLAKAGQLPGVKVGDSWRFDVERVDRWLARSAQKQGSK